MTIEISRVPKDKRITALRILFARFSLDEQESRLAETLKSAEKGSLNLNGLLLATENGQPVGAALCMHQPDGVTLVWPPVITCQAADGARVENGLMTDLCQMIDLAKSKMAQALLSPDDVSEIDLLQRHGFHSMGDMFFLARPMTDADIQRPPENGEFDHEIFQESIRDRFAAVIDRTYEQSLDCPFLDGFRSGNEALTSHRLSGAFDPAGWRIYRIGNEDFGVVLMNEHPDQNSIELVYFGIVPEFRGRGLGRRLLAEAIQAAALTGRIVIFLAVDCGNIYANALYSEIGFAELARRRVMVRRSVETARK